MNARTPQSTIHSSNVRLLRAATAALAILTLSTSATHSSAVFKDEFRVNAITAGRQYHGAVAADEQGRFAVVWESDVNGDFDAMIRCFDADGNPMSIEKPIHDSLIDHQRLPFVASDKSGRYIVTWSDGTESEKNLRQRVFDSATCTPLAGPEGDETTINVDLIPGHTAAALAAFEEGPHHGRWVVFWPQWIVHNQEAELLARLYEADGTPMTDPVRVNQADSIAQAPHLPIPDDTCTMAGEDLPCLKVAPTVAVDELGNAFFAWEHWDSQSLIRARRMNLIEDTAEDEVEINPTTDPEVYSRRPGVAVSPCGDSAYLVYTELKASHPDPRDGRSYYVKWENGQWDTTHWSIPESGPAGVHKPYVRMAPPDPITGDELVFVGWTHEHSDLFLRIEDPEVGELGTIKVNTSTEKTRQRMDFSATEFDGEARFVACWESYQETGTFDMFCKIYRY